MSLAFTPGLGYILDITTVLTGGHQAILDGHLYKALNMKGRLS